MRVMPIIISGPARQSSIYTRRARGASGEQGAILALALIMLGVMAALALEIQTLSRNLLRVEYEGLARARLRAAAGEGAWQALRRLASDATLLVDHTNEEWAAAVTTRLPDGITVRTEVTDENRRLDANMLASVSPSDKRRPAAAVFRDLLAAEGYPAPEMGLQFVLDWVDKDDAGGCEKEYYRSIESPVAPPDLPMESASELRWLLKDETNSVGSLAVLPSGGTQIESINVNTAGIGALNALFGGQDGALAERIVYMRGLAPILALDQVIAPQLLPRFASYLAVRSSYFSVRASAEMDKKCEEVYCLARRDQSGAVQVLRWIER